jgi:hypothetical protein
MRKTHYEGMKAFCRNCQREQRVRRVKEDQTQPCCEQCSMPLQDKDIQLDDSITWDKRRREPGLPDIRHPPRHSEYDVQIWLYFQLKDRLGWDVRLEVKVLKKKIRFDIVRYRDGVPVRIVEVKRAGRVITHNEFVCWHLSPKTEAQLNRYRAYGIPVDLVQGMKWAKEYVEWAEKIDR